MANVCREIGSLFSFVELLLRLDLSHYLSSSHNENLPFPQAFNRKEALSLGKIVPKPGVDEDFDRVKVGDENRSQHKGNVCRSAVK
jgi:hypothetical protein